MIRLFCCWMGLMFVAAAWAGDETITVGGEALMVPAPSGFARCDGIMPEFDAFIQSILPPTNRAVAYYGPPGLVEKMRTEGAQDLPSNCNIQVLRSVEKQRMSKVQFVGVRRQLKEELGAADLEKWDAELAKNVEGSGLSVGELSKPKIFEDSEAAFGFTLVMTAGIESEEASRSVVGVVMALVNGKMINLYKTIPLESVRATKVMEKSVLEWAEAIRAANPVFEPKFPLQNRMILFAVIGVVVGFLVLRSKKRKAA
jgi:hypothetical protein